MDLQFRRFFAFLRPTAKKARAVCSREAVIAPVESIKGLYRVQLTYYFVVHSPARLRSQTPIGLTDGERKGQRPRDGYATS